MSKYTKILVGKGGTGKTAELIKRSAESGIYILVANRKRAEILAKQAEDMKLYIPFPVTLQEWLRSSSKFHGSSIRRDGLLIDDIDDVIKELFSPIEIKAVTLRTPNGITNLDAPTADVAEVVRCKDCKHAQELDLHCEVNRGAYRHCALYRGNTEPYVWHKYKKYYKEYSIVPIDGFCDEGERREENEG